MRETVVTLLFVLLLGGLFGVAYCRSNQAPRSPDQTAARTGKTTKPAAMRPARAASMRPAPAMGAASAKQPSMGQRPVAVPKGPRPKATFQNMLGRPLRVVGADWALLAPSLLANGGLAAAKTNRYQKARLVVTHRRLTKIADVATALAKGGADPQGADIALLSLPTFVAAFEQLQGLKPRIFWVLGRSHGREALLGRSGATLLSQLPGRGPVVLAGGPGAPATLLGLFSLDLAGVKLGRVRVVAPSSEAGKKATLVARQRLRRRPAGERLLLSTAEVTQLIPFVAVCPAGFLEGQPKVISAWARVTLASARRLARNVPAAARGLAKVKGAPDLMTLLSRLGWVRYLDLPDMARLAGLSGRSAVSLYALFKRMWRLWREAGVLSTPVPEQLPLSTAVIAGLVRSAKPTKAAKRAPKRHRLTAQSLFLRALPSRQFSRALFTAEVGLLAGLFERSALELWIGLGRAKAEKLLKEIRDRFALPAGQLILGRLPRSLRRQRPKASIRVCQAR